MLFSGVLLRVFQSDEVVGSETVYIPVIVVKGTLASVSKNFRPTMVIGPLNKPFV